MGPTKIKVESKSSRRNNIGEITQYKRDDASLKTGEKILEVIVARRNVSLFDAQ